jgi:hypothetical protein
MSKYLANDDNCSCGIGTKNGPFGDLAEPRMGPFAARSGVLRRSSASSPSAQVKAAAAHVGDCNWK